MMRSIQRVTQGFFLAFLFVALALGYWGIARREVLLVRDDNPRRVLAEQRIQRGQIVDRNGVILAETVVDSQGEQSSRLYHYPEAAPVTGYYSFRYGVDGIESAFDEILRGDALLTPGQQSWGSILHRPKQGGDVQLTVDLAVQQSAMQALGQRHGAVVVLSVPEGEVLALASQPIFDPNQLDENWDDLTGDPNAPLLNRATQGLYQPGAILQSVLLGEAFNVGLASPTDPWTGSLTVNIDGTVLPCTGTVESPADLAGIYRAACPAPFQFLVTRMGLHRFLMALEDFRLSEPAEIEIPTASVDAELLDGSDLRLESVGQGELTVSPLHMARVAAAFANQGQIPPLRIVQAVRSPAGPWEPVDTLDTPKGAISPESAGLVTTLMAPINSAEAVDIYSHTGLSLSGPEGAFNGWFIGFVYRPDGGAIAAAVLVEKTGDPNEAFQIGTQVLLEALATAP